MPDVHDDLRALLRAVVIRSPMEYELAGRTHKVAPFGAGQSPTWTAYAAGQPPLVIDLQTSIYDEAYCRSLGSRTEPPPNAASLLEALSAANAGRDRWESGWTLGQMMPNGQALARKGDLANVFAPGEFVAAQGGAPSAGAPLHVFFARESRTQQPGFYLANGETPAPFGADSRMTRIYWHVTEEGAVPLTRAVTALLNRYQVPFRFKTLSYSGVYTRADAAVLYFASRYGQIVARLLPAIRAEVRGHLRPATPLLTLRLYDGVGLAEDPATGESFGMSRSRLIAQAIWDAYARGMQSEESRMTELAIQFDRIGLSLDRPHLRAASAGLYSDFYPDPQEAAA
ncbi:MAG TPA: T3SS effector HopA1 family protein [Thermoanaerobaculia bacterium]|nr:T3SS effector HopA1 family protein [Thermoanaerobaculia bacterium]